MIIKLSHIIRKSQKLFPLNNVRSKIKEIVLLTLNDKLKVLYTCINKCQGNMESRWSMTRQGYERQR